MSAHTEGEREADGDRSLAAHRACVAILVAFILRLGLPFLPVGGGPVVTVVAGLAVLAAFLVAAFLTAASLARSPLLALAASAGCAVVWGLSRAHLWPEGFLLLRAVGDVGLLAGAAALGALVSFAAREAKMLLPIGATIAVIDTVGVLSRYGFTARVLESHPEVVGALSATIPAIGAATPALHGTTPIGLGLIGVGDFLFLGLFFAVVTRFGMNGRAAAVAAVAACLAAMAIVLVTGGALPGLPFLVVGCLVPNLRWFRYTRDEMVAMAVAAVLVAVICAVMLAAGAGAGPGGG
jgi:hypothetical protein